MKSLFDHYGEAIARWFQETLAHGVLTVDVTEHTNPTGLTPGRKTYKIRYERDDS